MLSRLSKAERVVLIWSIMSAVTAGIICVVWPVSFSRASFEVLMVFGVTLILIHLYKEEK